MKYYKTINMEPPAPAEPQQPAEPEPKQVKTRKKREMTPELLDKLRLARERAAELRAQAKETKSKLPADIPEKERSKVAQYLATRKAIKAKIKEEVLEEMETVHPVDSKGYSLPIPKEQGPPVPKTEPVLTNQNTQRVKKVKEPEPESDSGEDEYTMIKVPKKKLVKWTKKAEKPPPEPEKPKNTRPQYSSYTTQHLVGLAMNGYVF
jgi:hypothetical protein